MMQYRYVAFVNCSEVAGSGQSVAKIEISIAKRCWVVVVLFAEG